MPNSNNSFWHDSPTTTTGSRNLSNQNIFVLIFLNEGSFLHLFDSLDSRIESNLNGLCLAFQFTFVLKKTRVLASQMNEI